MSATLDRKNNLDHVQLFILERLGREEEEGASHWQGADPLRLFTQVHFTLTLQIKNLNSAILTILK
jgi:hypothetical protein